MPEETSAPVYDDEDRRFGREAIRSKLVKPEMMKTIIAEQATLAAKGERRTLESLLVVSGAITDEDAARIKAAGDEAAQANTPSPDRPSETVGSTTPADAGLVSPILVTGALIGGWKLGRELGRGGMGIVFEARHEVTGGTAALKILRDPGRIKHVERFRRETEATRRLDHPNIVKLFEAGHAGDLPWYAMELVRGEQLDEWITKRKLAPREAVTLVRDVARAVHHAHALGVIHRDLKPGNVLVNEEGIPKVMDFGLAKLEDDDTKITRTNAGVGTPQYMSPEQAQGRPVDSRSDIFALGVVLHELVAGRIPWPGQTMIDVCSDIVNRPLPTYVADRALDRVMQKACEKAPAERYATAEELAKDLDGWLESGSVSATGPALPTRLKRVARKNVQALGGAAVACVLFLPILLGLGWRAARRAPAPPVVAQDPTVAPQGSVAHGPLQSSAGELEAFARVDARVRDAVKRDDIASACSEVSAFLAKGASPRVKQAALDLEADVLDQGRKLIAALADRGERVADRDVEDADKVLAQLRALRLPPSLAASRSARVEALARHAEVAHAALALKRAADAATAALDAGDLDAAKAALDASRGTSRELDAARARFVRLTDGRARLRAAVPDESTPPARLASLIPPKDRSAVVEYLLATRRAAAALALAEAANDAALVERARALVAAEESREARAALEAALARAAAPAESPAEASRALRAAMEKYRATPAFALMKDKLRDAFTSSRQRAIERDPTLIPRGGRATFADGVYAITYSWADARAGGDWLPDPQVPQSAIRVDTTKRVATIKGHMTNAVHFAGRVRVRSLAGSGGVSPNVNVVFHDAGTAALLVGLGFDDDRGEVALEDGRKAKLPATLVGVASDQGWRFVETTSRPFEATPARPVRLEVLRDETSVVARVDGGVAIRRDGLEQPGKGGVGFRPGPGCSLILAETTLEGKLDAEWLASVARDQARREAAELARPE